MAHADNRLTGDDEPEQGVRERYNVYALGSNGAGQLGIGHRADTSKPTLGHSLYCGGHVVKVACGGNHTIFLHSSGRSFATGDNSDGRCLTKPQADVTRPEQLTTPIYQPGDTEFSVEHIAATWSSTLAISPRGRLFTCGTGNSGELGLGKGKETALEPTVIEDFPPPGTKVVRVASCMAHTVVVLSNGEVWGWGKGRQGQLGTSLEHRWHPSKIEGIPFFVVDAVCGKDFTCVLGHPCTGELLMLGPSGKDRFGVKADAPTSVPNWKQVAASWGSVFVLLESGQLLGWGRDDHGQLPPLHLPCLRSIVAGSEHCLGLTAKEGKVLAWGWGEHGNCGPDTDANGDVRGRWNELQTPHPATAIFAGCATSFVVTRESFHSAE